jgi:hypothetical protein
MSDLLQFRIQQFLRSGLFHILLCDHANSGVYFLFDLFSFGCRKGSFNTVLTYAKWILNYERSDRAIFQEFNWFLVGVEGNKFDSIAGLVLCNGLSAALSDEESVRESPP